jgi:hypothetical protein
MHGPSSLRPKGKQSSGTARRGDVVPRLSYASVEEAFLELAAASPVRSAAQSLGRRVTSTLEGLKARRSLRGARVWRQRGAQLACRRPSSVAPRRARVVGA